MRRKSKFSLISLRRKGCAVCYRIMATGRLQNQPAESLRKQLALAVKRIQWSYAIFWSISCRQPGYSIVFRFCFADVLCFIQLFVFLKIFRRIFAANFCCLCPPSPFFSQKVFFFPRPSVYLFPFSILLV